MPDTRMQNDEPTRDDQLGRSEFARALATIATTSETPLVIGLYGRWGAGKTSLMRIVQSKLDADGETKTVWFDAWRHQFDEHPALGLMHTMVNELGIQESAKCALTTVARALGSWALKATTSLDIGDIEGSLRKYEEQNFKIRDDRTRLYESFEEIVRTAQGTAESTEHRIVFFIDDLDRCLPAHILSVLESLKLFLNIQGCVYFLGVDRHALEGSIRQHYEDCELDEVSYLDKIIQLPFTIPPISEGAARNFIQKLLPDELSNCRPILEAGLGRNPRGIKRFIRTLQLNQALAKRIIPSHRPQVLAALLLIQYSKPELYSDIAGSPGLLYELVSESDKSAQLCEEYLAGDELLLEALRLVDLPDQEILRQYIYLTSATGITPDDVKDDHGFYTEQGIDQLLAASGKMGSDETVREKLLLFRTRRQHTWLVTTNKHLWCLLDDARMREQEKVIRWKQPLDAKRKVRCYISVKGNRVIDLGRKAPWLYSRILHPDPSDLQRNVETMIENAISKE